MPRPIREQFLSWVLHRFGPSLLQHRESAEVAKALIMQTCEQQQQIGRDQLTVHADHDSAMTSKPVAFLLADLGVLKLHNRPYTSSDNLYSEAQFKTLSNRTAFPCGLTQSSTLEHTAPTSSPGTTTPTATPGSA